MLHLFEKYMKDQEKLVITREILQGIYALSENKLLDFIDWGEWARGPRNSPTNILGQLKINMNEEIEACLGTAFYSVIDYESFNALSGTDKKHIKVLLSSKLHEESLKYESSYSEIHPNGFFAVRVAKKTAKGLSLSFRIIWGWDAEDYVNEPREINFPLGLFANKVEFKSIIQQAILDHKYSKYSDVLLNPFLRVGSSTHGQDIEMTQLSLH